MTGRPWRGQRPAAVTVGLFRRGQRPAAVTARLFRRGRRSTVTGGAVARWSATALACLLVLFALSAPNDVHRLTPAALLRIPLEGLAGIALLLALPVRARRVGTVLLGVVLGLLSVLTIVDMGFFAVLARPFNPVLDWSMLGATVDFLTGSIGRVGAIGSVVGAALLVIALPVLMALSLRRLTGLLVRRRGATARVVASLAAAWIICAAFNVQIVPGVPVAADSAVTFTRDSVVQVRDGLRDRRDFAAAAAVDAFRDTPGEQLLTSLRGKDVAVAFVESYGRDAVENPLFASGVGAVLDTGSRQLSAAGFSSRSAFLTSPTAGGGSWLAHATLLSGLWIDSQQRYRSLVSSDRLTLPGAFQRAGWRTVAVMPGTTRAWPERSFYCYDQAYDRRALGYRGKPFSWISGMPDQYTLSAFERSERGMPDRSGPGRTAADRAAPDRAPVMAEIDLTSSHEPWAPIPRLIDWNSVGDGSVFSPMVTEGDPPDVVWRDTARIRTEYRRSIEYSLNTLISYVETYGDDNLVLVFLGDHQPAPLVTGQRASRDVPVTIVARDRAVLDRISGWGWTDGLRPDPQAPVWRMDTFRDRFLTAFGA